jgi:hypothetical protein
MMQLEGGLNAVMAFDLAKVSRSGFYWQWDEQASRPAIGVLRRRALAPPAIPAAEPAARYVSPALAFREPPISLEAYIGEPCQGSVGYGPGRTRQSATGIL